MFMVIKFVIAWTTDCVWPFSLLLPGEQNVYGNSVCYCLDNRMCLAIKLTFAWTAECVWPFSLLLPGQQNVSWPLKLTFVWTTEGIMAIEVDNA